MSQKQEVEEVKEKKTETKEKKIILDEENEEISIGFSTFKKYFSKYNGGCIFVFAMNLCMFVQIGVEIST